ncbi:MAG: hypothetical protein HQ582_23375 [Planctomycetes bacterium]|nr:hypothetical protein [Planctomycetota bacterium]
MPKKASAKTTSERKATKGEDGTDMQEREPTPFVPSLDEIAKRFGVSRPEVRRWRDKEECEVLRKSPYDTVAVQQWLNHRAGLQIDPDSKIELKKLQEEVERLQQQNKFFSRDKYFWIAVAGMGITVSSLVWDWLRGEQGADEEVAGKDSCGELRMPITGMRLSQFIQRLRSCEKVTSVSPPYRAMTSTPSGLFAAQPVSASLGCVKCLVTLCGPGKKSATLEVSGPVLDPNLPEGIVRHFLRECQLFGPNGELHKYAQQVPPCVELAETKCKPCETHTAGKSPFYS